MAASAVDDQPLLWSWLQCRHAGHLNRVGVGNSLNDLDLGFVMHDELEVQLPVQPAPREKELTGPGVQKCKRCSRISRTRRFVAGGRRL